MFLLLRLYIDKRRGDYNIQMESQNKFSELEKGEGVVSGWVSIIRGVKGKGSVEI